jgi:uncharacterized membrane protein (DUF485 family)
MTSTSDGAPTASEQRVSRLGVILFAVYFILYAGFMALNVIDPLAMSRPLGPLNIAVAYGFALILVAFALAVVYTRVAGSPQGRS